MIFIAVGSQKFQFNRLLEEIDLLIERGIITDKVIAQTGASDYIPKRYKYKDYYNQTEFTELITSCDILVTHGGTGVIVKGLKLGKKIIAVPRLAKYKEHVDNHQIELLQEFQEKQYILTCENIKDLENVFKIVKDFAVLSYESNTEAYVEELTSCLNELIPGKRNYTWKKKLHKYIEYGTTKVKMALRQKKYNYQGTSIHYISEECNSDTIVFVFSSCTRIGVKARYNYMRTLNKCNVNKMFILDDYGEDNRGVYYLGKNMDFHVERAVSKLIEKTLNSGKYKKIIFAGSSKGGYGAFDFGMQIPGSVIIAGASQYHLGSYFMDESNKLELTLRYVTGKGYDETSAEQIEELNTHLEKRIKGAEQLQKKPKVYLHYSNKEHTYEEHIIHLLRTLKEGGFEIKEDVRSYTNHSDVSMYFPQFMVNCIEEVLHE